MIYPTKNIIFLELHVPDFIKVKDFYDKLDFKVVWEDPRNYLVMQLGDNVLGFYGGSEKIYKHPFFGQFPKSTVRGYGVEITIQVVDDIQNYYKKTSPTLPKDAISMPLTQVNYKTSQKWEFRLVDPFGYYLHFTEPVNYLYQ